MALEVGNDGFSLPQAQVEACLPFRGQRSADPSSTQGLLPGKVHATSSPILDNHDLPSCVLLLLSDGMNALS